MKNFTLAVTLLITFSVQSQIGMGTPNPDASAVLELASTQKGFLPPRLTTLERDAIVHPPVGLTIFNTIKNCLEWYNISGWYNACGDNPVALANYTCDTLETGTMTEGIPVSGVSQTITAAVSFPGSYDISTTNNGVTFSAKGYFTSKGNHDVILHAKGTPIADGFHTFTISGTATCSFGRSVNLSPATVSSYNCNNTTNSGTMVVGTAVIGITQTITATVTKIGAYSITTNTVNGVTFSASGTFSATGSQDVILTATGTPIAMGFHNFTLNTTPGCSFDRPTIDANTVVGKAGKIWMAYNLGATAPATSVLDSAQYGDLYQWGRRSDGHEKLSSPITTTLSNNDTPNGSFISPRALPFDWRSTSNDNLWQGVRGTNNPCPAGFRIPTEKEWEEECTTSNIVDAASAYNSVLKLPAPNYRYHTGNYEPFGTYHGRYWASDVNPNGYSVYMWINSTHQGIFVTARGNGFSVRCIKE